MTTTSALITNETCTAQQEIQSWITPGGTLRILTTGFEVTSLAALTNWQSAAGVQILLGCPEKPANKNEFLAHLFEQDNRAIETCKQKGDDLEGLIAIRDALQRGTVQVKAYLREKLHADGYIWNGANSQSSALVGSSTFTESGLTQRNELNANVDAATASLLNKQFEAWYARAEDIGKEIIAHIERHIRLFTPYEVYLKALYEYFRGREIPATVWEEQESRMYQILSEYQRDAYRQLLRIATRYNGAMLCDGVGLGKTFVALMLIERMIHERKRVVIIVPKSAREAVWEASLRRYIPEARGVFGNQVVVYNHTDLLRGATTDRDFSAELREVRDHADVIIVDEAHHFRTSSSRRSLKLYELAEGKQIFLLTATPINNTLFDLQHLIEFFTRRDDNRFGHLGINSIRGYLIQKEKLIEERMKQNTQEAEVVEAAAGFADYDTVKAEQILNDDRLFREIVVQRSRSYVKQREQLGQRQTLFPERQPPEVAGYSIKSTYGKLLDDLRDAFDRDDPLLKLAVYYPMAYARKPADSADDLKEANRQKQVVGLVRTTLLKRFESSWKAFQYSCEDLLYKLAATVRQYDEKKYDGWRKANTLWMSMVEQHMRERLDIANGEEIEEEDILDSLAEDLPALDARLHHIDTIVQDTLDDMDLLVRFLGDIQHVSVENDNKFQKLLAMLRSHPLLSQHKVVIFTEFRDTARYLARALREAGISHIEQIDSGSKVDRLEVIRRFAPFYNYDTPEKHQKALANPIRVLISTDVLSEGLNLQDAFLLMNYDLHWNPVRLMQRIGRVDRRMNPETEARLLAQHPAEKPLRGKVWFWNFLPPGELSDILSLYKRVAHKVLKISETTGLEGAQLLSPDDHFNTLKNFNESYEGTPSTDERLRLLLNQALQNDPTLEAQLMDFPGRIFSARTNPVRGLFACYRLPALGASAAEDTLGELRWYFLAEDGSAVLTSIDEVDRHIACMPETALQESSPHTTRLERLKKIENYIKTNELKKIRNVTMQQVAGDASQSNRMMLVAWLEII